MFRAIVVDDEQLARDRILSLLKQDDEITVVGECSSGTEAIEQINTAKPDIVFLDIEIPDANAFQVISEINCPVRPYIIFVTAYIKYLKKQQSDFEMAYLLKPFNTMRFNQVLSSVKEKLSECNDESGL